MKKIFRKEILLNQAEIQLLDEVCTKHKISISKIIRNGLHKELSLLLQQQPNKELIKCLIVDEKLRVVDLQYKQNMRGVYSLNNLLNHISRMFAVVSFQQRKIIIKQINYSITICKLLDRKDGVKIFKELKKNIHDEVFYNNSRQKSEKVVGNERENKSFRQADYIKRRFENY